MGCSCSTRWTQKDKYGTAKIKLGSSSIDPSQPTYDPTPNPPINIGGGSWAFKRNNPSLAISDGASLASNEHIVSTNYTGPFAVQGGCSGSGGSSCDCLNTNNGSGSLISSISEADEKVNDSNINDVTKSGRWIYTWTSTGQTYNGPDATEKIKVRIEHQVKVKKNKYCYGHECPDGGGSTDTGDFGDLGSWLASMIDAGNSLVGSACD